MQKTFRLNCQFKKKKEKEKEKDKSLATSLNESKFQAW